MTSPLRGRCTWRVVYIPRTGSHGGGRRRRGCEIAFPAKVTGWAGVASFKAQAAHAKLPSGFPCACERDLASAMLQLASRLLQFEFASGPADFPRPQESMQPTQGFEDCLLKLRRSGGLRKEAIFCNLRVPNQFQTAKEEIDLVILSGHGVFCIDVKTWRGSVSAQVDSWQLQYREQKKHFTNTSINQVPDPIRAIKSKTANLWSHVVRSGVSIRQALFLPRLLFLSPDCLLDEELTKREEVVAHGDLDAFARSFKEGYLAWISDAVSPSWLSGHLSYRQLAGVQEALQRTGTWDTVSLLGGGQLRGDYRGCQHLALSREETDELLFSCLPSLPSRSLWALLGYSPQVTVKMYKRGAQGWLGKPLLGTATIPCNTHILFRVCGEDTDAKIPAHQIERICLSI
ncbi:uncharacterized protein LOC136716075 [Amia ocellicauda]|uniref:uncharacterized protein LOC136716075 n=1 Tax=Amia ocellicauda TaxID=2972642 RepID=UPI003463C825